MTNRFTGILLQQFRQALNKGPELGIRLFVPLVLLVGHATTDNVSDGIAGKVEVAGYLAISLAVSEMSLTDFTDGLHVQHLL